MAVGPHSPRSAVSSIAPSDSVSMSGRNLSACLAPGADRRSKYNTLTPAEAKQMTRRLSNRQPTRTASVLRKPRAPPMVVQNLTSTVGVWPTLANANGLPIGVKHPDVVDFGSSYSLQSSRVQRRLDEPVNLGKRITPYGSLFRSDSRQSAKNPSNAYDIGPSFRNSSSLVGSRHDAARFHTMSVDLGNPSSHFVHRIDPDEETFHECQTKEMLSDESFTSAKSHHSDCAKLKGSSKISLSSSTSKVFQNQLSTLKRFLKNMPIGRSIVGGPDQKLEGGQTHEENLDHSISQLSLNRSQSPPTCPPPPGELRSMSYMENPVNYVNYDEFTRARNRQSCSLMKSQNRDSPPNQYIGGGSDNQNVDADTEHWQLTSLPVSYERNLATVFEERQSSRNVLQSLAKDAAPKGYIEPHPVPNIQPPSNFEDEAYGNSGRSSDTHKTNSSSESSNSLTSITTADSVLEYHRQTATSFKYSYAQPISFKTGTPKNDALPPRIPTNDSKQGALCNTLATSSRLTNGMQSNNVDNQAVKCDRQNYGTANDLAKDADLTILSDTSTIHGDSGNSIYVNKCAELERSVGSLKEKLITKEKELTEMQLKQWSSDYLIDQLKSTISRLEKENAQLKALVKVSRNNL